MSIIKNKQIFWVHCSDNEGVSKDTDVPLRRKAAHMRGLKVVGATPGGSAGGEDDGCRTEQGFARQLLRPSEVQSIRTAPDSR
jgi:hypothetical protein